MKYINKNIPDFTASLQLLKKDIFANLNCHQVGIIESFDNSTQTVRVQIATKRIVDVSLNGAITYNNYPLLVDVPVISLYGGDSGMTFPIKKGDECLILFNDRQIDNWFNSGGIQPFNILRLHDLSDGFALVGIRSLQKVLKNYSNNKTEWFFNDLVKISQGATSTDIKNILINLIGNTVASGTLLANGFISADGSAGITTTQTFKDGADNIKTMIIKNGLITGIQ